MPAAPPPTPVSRGLGSPRYHGGLEGMAAPSLRYTGAHPAHVPASAFAALTGALAGHLTRTVPGSAQGQRLLTRLFTKTGCSCSWRTALLWQADVRLGLIQGRWQGGMLSPLGEGAWRVDAKLMPDAWAGAHSTCLLLQANRMRRRARRRGTPLPPRAHGRALCPAA